MHPSGVGVHQTRPAFQQNFNGAGSSGTPVAEVFRLQLVYPAVNDTPARVETYSEIRSQVSVRLG